MSSSEVGNKPAKKIQGIKASDVIGLTFRAIGNNNNNSPMKGKQHQEADTVTLAVQHVSKDAASSTVVLACVTGEPPPEQGTGYKMISKVAPSGAESIEANATILEMAINAMKETVAQRDKKRSTKKQKVDEGLAMAVASLEGTTISQSALKFAIEKLPDAYGQSGDASHLTAFDLKWKSEPDGEGKIKLVLPEGLKRDTLGLKKAILGTSIFLYACGCIRHHKGADGDHSGHKGVQHVLCCGPEHHRAERGAWPRRPVRPRARQDTAAAHPRPEPVLSPAEMPLARLSQTKHSMLFGFNEFLFIKRSKQKNKHARRARHVCVCVCWAPTAFS
jgi:hypothetical protein